LFFGGELMERRERTKRRELTKERELTRQRELTERREITRHREKSEAATKVGPRRRFVVHFRRFASNAVSPATPFR
jgi:hypothetical protein